MKKTNLSAMAATAAAIAGVVMINACGGPKSLTKVEGEVEIIVPCDNFYSNSELFRGQGVGQSKDLNTARDKARLAANNELAGGITLVIKAVTEKYVNDAGQSPADYGETFEQMIKQVVSQQISNITVACNKTMKTKDGMFKVYMATEVSRTAAFEAADRIASKDKKLETIYDREKFRETFNAEMEALAKERGR